MMPRAILFLLLTAVTVFGAPSSAAAADDLIEGKPFTGLIATFTGPAVPTQVTIDWGDGTAKQPSAVTKEADEAGHVVALHTYRKFGFYSVTVTDSANPDVYQRTSFNVKDAPVSGQGTTFKSAAAPGGVTVATLDDANPLGSAADFKASIDWGDGSVSDGVISPAGTPGQYTVSGTHTYPDGASYLAGVTVKSTDSGDANVAVQTTADGVPDPAATVPAGKVLDFGRGDTPSIAVDEEGTANLVYSIPAPGRTGDAVVYCKLPRGARACAIKRTLQVDALTEPVILRDRNGTLRIVISYNGVLQLGGGTLVVSSTDGGNTWGYAFSRVNTGVFQGSVIDAALSNDGRVLYALFGDFVPGDKAQVFAQIGLDRPVLSIERDPGASIYSARAVAALPDGRIVLAGFDTDQIKPPTGNGKVVSPRAALRVVADADGNLVSAPWTPIRAGAVFRLASSLRGASLLGAPTCNTGEEVSPLRGLTLGAPRPIGADGAQSCGTKRLEDLTYDIAGGRHAVWTSTYDGCQGPNAHTSSQQGCIIYRRARPGGDFGPKTTIAAGGLGSPHGLTVGAGRDGEGWIAWRELGVDGVPRVKVAPTETSSEEAVGAAHRIAMTFKPGAECSKSGNVTIGVQVVGPTKNKPKISSVDWSSSSGLLPRRKSDDAAPYSTRFSVDRRAFRNLSSTGVLVFTMTVRGKVRYRFAGKRQTAQLEQVVSFYCGVKFDKVKKR